MRHPVPTPHGPAVLCLADPNSGGSSFSMLLGPAPHLDKRYTIFGLVRCGWTAVLRCVGLRWTGLACALSNLQGSVPGVQVGVQLQHPSSVCLAPCPLALQVTQGFETLAKLEELPTRKEGIFVMPLDRISILSTYM